MEIRPKQRAAVSKVLLVGGATRMPAVRRFITNMTGLQPEVAEVDPDEAVALGAAIQAGILQGEVQDMMVMEQWQASLMRALAQMQLKSNPKAKQMVEQQYDLEGLGEGEQEDEQVLGMGEDGVGGAPQQQQQKHGRSRERPKAAKRRKK
jgi:molecular chaperone DnaK